MGCRYLDLDLAEIERLAGLGLTEAEICTSIGIHNCTLTRRKRDNYAFIEALARGKAKAHAIVANALMEQVLEGNVTAIIWYEKTRRGLSDRLEITGVPEKPIIASESHHPLTGFTRGPITDSSRLLEDHGSGSWTPVGEDGTWGSDGGDDGSRE